MTYGKVHDCLSSKTDVIFIRRGCREPRSERFLRRRRYRVGQQQRIPAGEKILGCAEARSPRHSVNRPVGTLVGRKHLTWAAGNVRLGRNPHRSIGQADCSPDEPGNPGMSDRKGRSVVTCTYSIRHCRKSKWSCRSASAMHGLFSEVWNARAFASVGDRRAFVQDNHVRNPLMGTLRGLHYQMPPAAQGELCA